MAEPPTIFEAATACRLLFRTATRTPRLMQQEWAENRLADFNLWAMGAGATSTTKASLDHRLRANPEAHTILLNLLLMLKILIQKCIDGGSEIDDPIAKLSSGQLSRMKNVEDSLNQLTRLTVAIRKAGTRSRLQKADSSFDPHSPQIRSLRRHLEVLLLARPDEHGNSDYCEQHLDPTRLSPIQLRLIEANLKRRNRFIYAQRHAQKLEGHQKNMTRESTALGKQRQGSGVNPISQGGVALVREDIQAQSTTTATKVDDAIEIPPEQVPRSATTVVSVTSSRITYPTPPRFHDQQMLFTCPCCCQSLSVAIGRGNRWKKHLMGDILPYTCVVDGCSRVDTFHMNKEAWLIHMNEEHGGAVQWVCHACSQRNIYATFGKSDDFTAHLEQQHGKGIKPGQIPMLLSSWRRKVPFKFSACPLCSFQSDDQTALLDHTAEHIHSFSLRSLPWAPRERFQEDDDEQDDDNDEEEDGSFFKDHAYFDINSCWSEPSASSPGGSRLATDSESIAGSDSTASFHPVHEQQQQLTEVLLNRMPQELLGQAGTSDWLDSLALHSDPEDRLGLILGNKFRLTSILGVGTYSVVYHALDLDTSVLYAIKALSKIGKDSRQLKFLQEEVRLHHEANSHLNIVSLLRIVDAVDCLYLVFEYFPEGDLFANITEKGRFVGNNTLVKHAFLQILDAVQHCHSLGIYHRNLKPENFLVAEEGMTIKLGDFSLATKETSTSDFGCGSVFYMSPECQNPDPPPGSTYLSGPNDVWSLGVILVNLTCGRNPWKRASTEDATFRAYLKDPFFLKTILPLTDEMVVILCRIFELDPSKRITIPELHSLILDCPRFTEDPMLPQYLVRGPPSLEESLQTLNFSPEDLAPEGRPANLNHMLATSPLPSTAKDDDDDSLFRDHDDESIFQDKDHTSSLQDKDPRRIFKDEDDESIFQDGWGH